MASVEQLLETPNLAAALESDRFKQFLDQIPIALAVSELHPTETVVYANLEFERLSGQLNATVLGADWHNLPGQADATPPLSLGEAIVHGRDNLGSFTIPNGDASLTVDAWSNLIEDDDGTPVFRLVALLESPGRDGASLDKLAEQVREKDTHLLELQHRVKNNLQMITALIRIEARGVADRPAGDRFDRLAGRVEALGLLYHALGDSAGDGVVDLGIYLSEVASAVMRAHAMEGIHLNLQVDTWMVSLNVAMPAGLVVNELLTNALKHAFQGRDGGAITLHSTTDATGGCRVLVADDGVGLPGAMDTGMDKSFGLTIMRERAAKLNGRLTIESRPAGGTIVRLAFPALQMQEGAK